MCLRGRAQLPGQHVSAVRWMFGKESRSSKPPPLPPAFTTSFQGFGGWSTFYHYALPWTKSLVPPWQVMAAQVVCDQAAVSAPQ